MTARFWPILALILLSTLVLRESGREETLPARLDAAFLDWIAANAHAQSVAPDPTLTLVELNDTVLGTPAKWPLPALDYALFLQALESLQPAVVAIEPPLVFPPAQAEQERMLANRALTIPKLVLGCTLGRTALSADVENETVATTTLPPGLRDVRGDLTLIPEYDDIIARPAPDLAALAPELAPVNLGDAPPRAVPLLVRCRGRVLPTLVLRVAIQQQQLTADRVIVWLGSHIQLGDARRIPIDEAGRMLLDTRSARRISRLGLDELLLVTAGGEAAKALEKRIALPARAGVVLLGRTDAALRRLRWPDGTAGAPVEWLAAGIAAIQRGDFIVRPGIGGTLVLLAASVIGGLWILTRSRSAALPCALLALALYAITASLVFGQMRLWLPLSVPAAVAIGTGLLRTVLRNV